MHYTALVFVAILALASAVEIYLSTCARMDTPILEKVAQGACISSCKFQNCGTGHCERRGGRAVCVCSRCDRGGGSWPSVPGRKR
ncbi:hypothetical protein AB6A40_011393 [Gnathostoma spinigerum]|uniref:Uncharacterized protein n=1 Tax=Gnathostoma spinigerum TaxID=75299 RepID=A0ABD6F1N9_9BILA